jgi:hypothetical protein
VSGDGRHWTQLPAGTFGTTYSDVVAAAAGNVLVVFGLDHAGVSHEYRSTDGLAWDASRPAVMGSGVPRLITGSARGFLALMDATPSRLVFSRDALSWATVTLPLTAPGDVAFPISVASTPDGFVAVGDGGPVTAATGVVEAVSKSTPSIPVGWYSADGTTWQAASVEQGVTESLGALSVGAEGLIAIGFAGGAPGIATYWTSADGRAWAPGVGPLGIETAGDGVGSVSGAFFSDGTRILVFGRRNDQGPVEWLTSADGRSWTELQMTGVTSDFRWYEVEPMLVPDGIVFAAPRTNWLGVAAP